MHDASRSVSLRFPRPAARVRRILSALAMLAPIVAGAPAAAQFAPPARPAAKAEPTTGEEAVRVRWAVVGEAKPGGTVR
ncbi:MAG: hypothetical protein RI967_1238, partial [Planctomycetota bacterium]